MKEARDHVSEFSNEISQGITPDEIKDLVEKKRQFILKTGHLPGTNVPNVNNSIQNIRTHAQMLPREFAGNQA